MITRIACNCAYIMIYMVLTYHMTYTAFFPNGVWCQSKRRSKNYAKNIFHCGNFLSFWREKKILSRFFFFSFIRSLVIYTIFAFWHDFVQVFLCSLEISRDKNFFIFLHCFFFDQEWNDVFFQINNRGERREDNINYIFSFI